MWPMFVNRPSSKVTMSKFFACFNYIIKMVINGMSMSICKTTNNVYRLVLGNPLTS